MARLRHPTEGCPWDRDQTFASVAPYTIEEAYEVADAIQHGNKSALKEELGDLKIDKFKEITESHRRKYKLRPKTNF